MKRFRLEQRVFLNSEILEGLISYTFLFEFVSVTSRFLNITVIETLLKLFFSQCFRLLNSYHMCEFIIIDAGSFGR